MSSELDSKSTRIIHKKLSNIKSLEYDMKRHSMRTSIAGRTKNFGDFKGNAYLPVYEAFVNSIHAIEDYKDFLKNPDYRGEIKIHVNRGAGQANATDGKVERKNKEIVSFDIEDNGIGFNETNFDSFLTSESDYKHARGGKGIGRFSWLKAFERAEIQSVYIDENNVKMQRDFTFSTSGILESVHKKVSPETPNKTIVRLIDFKRNYRDLESAWKKPKTIAERTLSHCFFYYIKKTAPKTILFDEDTFPLDDLYGEMILDQKNDTIDIEGHEFNIVHIKTRFTYNDKNNIVFCAVNREVETRPLEDYIGTNQLIDKDGDRFYYSVYISSKHLDEFVNATRTSFDLPNKSDLSTFTEGKLSFEKIIKAILIKTDSYLRECLDKLNDEKQKMVDEFVSKNPEFRYILSYYNKEIYDEITANYTPEKLNALFYKYKGLLEYDTKKRAEEFINLKTQKMTYKEIKEKYEHITEDLTHVNSADVVKYMLWRKLIIQALEKKIQLTENEDYETEDIIHDLVFPRGNTSDQLPYENINLWIIDEKLEYHKLAVSDLKNKKYSTSTDNARADILVCLDGEENKPATSVAIVEFKRPMRNHYDRDPIQQMYDIIEDIRDKKLKTDNGRLIQFNHSTRYNCYLICDINKEIDGYANGKNFIKLNDETGYYGHNQYYNAYTEVMSFDEVLDSVKKRHKRFFEKLGIPQQI